MAEARMPALYLTSSEPTYERECDRTFSGKVQFVLRGHLDVALGGIRAKYPTGTLIAVDDQPIMQDLYRTALQGSEMSLDFHNSPLTALVALRSGGKPDVIFSDVKMPQMDGFEFMAQVMKVYASE